MENVHGTPLSPLSGILHPQPRGILNVSLHVKATRRQQYLVGEAIETGSTAVVATHSSAIQLANIPVCELNQFIARPEAALYCCFSQPFSMMEWPGTN